MEHFLAGSFYINSFNQILREVAGGVGGRTGMEWWSDRATQWIYWTGRWQKTPGCTKLLEGAGVPQER